MFPKIVDITAITGINVVGAATSWQVQNGPFNVEHLATVNAENELFVFSWSPQLTGRPSMFPPKPGDAWQARPPVG
jgi:hypothetical protein